jgi:hypothetical protein
MTSITLIFFSKLFIFPKILSKNFDFGLSPQAIVNRRKASSRRRRRGIWAEQPPRQKGFSPLPGWLFSHRWLPHLLVTNVKGIHH